MGLDFINRIIKTTLLLSALVFIFGSVYFSWIFSLGIFVGTLWGIVNLWLIRQFVVGYITAADRNAGRLALFAIIKFPVLYAVGFFLLRLGWFPVLSFVVGFSLIFVVIFFKALGIFLLEGGFKKFKIVERRIEG